MEDKSCSLDEMAVKRKGLRWEIPEGALMLSKPGFAD